MVKFFDTCALLDLQMEAFETDKKFYISNITLIELEQIKTSATRDEDIKYKARKLLHLLNEHNDRYNTIIYNVDKFDPYIKNFGLMINNDSRIIATAYDLMMNGQDILFMTSDLNCREIAYSLGLDTMYLGDIKDDNYTGFKIIDFDETELALFYGEVLQYNQNPYNLLINEYLLIKDRNKIIDEYKWTESGYIKIPFTKAESKQFGKIVPLNGDPYQKIALDSLASNQITMLRGSAGTGKSYLAFGYMFELLEEGKIDKIVIFCNTVATKGSAKLGFYPGSRTEKLLDSQIGNLLESKIGSKIAVEKLIDEDKLVLLPMSDIRGYDTTGMNCAVYITEAQNLDIELMRLALQRIGEDSICILDGDSNAQVDLAMYAGNQNGMRRVSKVFRNNDCYGEVTLQNIYRSRIANLAQSL